MCVLPIHFPNDTVTYYCNLTQVHLRLFFYSKQFRVKQINEITSKTIFTLENQVMSTKFQIIDIGNDANKNDSNWNN
jgi:hypothetical protein